MWWLAALCTALPRRLAHAGAQARRRQASEALRGQLEASEASLRQAYAQLQAAHRQCEQLQAQLDKVGPVCA